MLINLLTIANRHSAEDGTPPSVNANDPNLYVGYFMNPHGEQWLFVFDRTTRLATVWGGDDEWRPREVRNGRALGLILGTEEFVWLENCWNTAIAPSDE